MARPDNIENPGMKRAVTGSLVVHGLLLAIILFTALPNSSRVMQAPVFVEIITDLKEAAVTGASPAAPAPQPPTGITAPDKAEITPPAASAKTSGKDAPLKTAVKTDPGKRPPFAPEKGKGDIKTNETEKKAINAASHSASASIEEALKKITDKVKKKEETEAVESRIAELRRKDETEKAAVERGIAEVKNTLSKKAAGARPPSSEGPFARNQSAPGAPGEARFQAYYSLVKDRVQARWIYPEGFNADNVSVVIWIKISKKGSVLESRVEKSSGNRSFDESLLNAVRKAEPFPPLPQDFRNVYLETGLRFCPLCKE